MIVLHIASHRRMVQSRVHYSCTVIPPMSTADSQHTSFTISTYKGYSLVNSNTMPNSNHSTR